MPVVLVPDRNGDCAAPALGTGDHAVELLELLDGAFDNVADLFLHFLG